MSKYHYTSFETKSLIRFAIFVLLLVPLTVTAQNKTSDATKPSDPPPSSGKYEGVVKSSAGDMAVTLELKNEDGKFSGQMITPHGAMQITKGSFAKGELSLEFGATPNVGTLTARPHEDKLSGQWSLAGQAGSVDLKRVEAKTAVTEAKPPATADPISGEWDAVADAQGEPFPFTLTLKIEGEKVTGSSSSQLGNSTISSGSWKDGKLAFVLDSSGGQIAMTGTLQDGKLVGDFDYSGQMTGKWVAVKSKP